MGLIQKVRTIGERVVDKTHDIAAVGARIARVQDEVTITPDQTDTLWRPGQAGRPLYDIHDQPVPNAVVVAGQGNPRYVPLPQQPLHLNTWYTPGTGRVNLVTASTRAGVLADGEPWRQVLRNPTQQHVVTWFQGGQDRVRGRTLARTQATVSSQCALAVGAAHDHEKFVAILATLPDLVIPELTHNFKMRGVLNQDVVERVIPAIAGTVTNGGTANISEYLRAGTLLVAAYLHKNPAARNYFRSTNINDSDTRPLEQAVLNARRYMAACVQRTVDASGAQIFIAGAAGAQVAQVVHADADFAEDRADMVAAIEVVRRRRGGGDRFSVTLHDMTRTILNNCTDVRQAASAWAMITAGIQLYGQRKAEKYERHGNRISVALQLVGALLGAAPYGAGVIAAPIVIIGSSLMDHVSRESANGLRASMDDVVGRIKGHHMHPNDPMLGTFTDHLEICQLRTRLDVKKRYT